jgi:hypothetical protein
MTQETTESPETSPAEAAFDRSGIRYGNERSESEPQARTDQPYRLDFGVFAVVFALTLVYNLQLLFPLLSSLFVRHVLIAVLYARLIVRTRSLTFDTPRPSRHCRLLPYHRMDLLLYARAEERFPGRKGIEPLVRKSGEQKRTVLAKRDRPALSGLMRVIPAKAQREA